jgi:hypothetical protein
MYKLYMTTINASDNIEIQQVDGIISYTLGGSTTVISTFPIEIINATSPIIQITVSIMTNIIVSSANFYFVIASSNITFDGLYNTITIVDVSNYPGLLLNGAVSFGSPANPDILITSVNLLSEDSTLAEGAGWICRKEFCARLPSDKTCNITECSSSGPISDSGGGIVGSLANASSEGTLDITNCFSSGSISLRGGGIVGHFSNNQSTGTLNIDRCYTTGVIAGGGAGGIVGAYSNIASSGFFNITNCYTMGFY